MKTPREIYKDYLKSKGDDWSDERREVLKAVFNLHRHFTLPEIRDVIKASCTNANLERIMMELVDAGLIRKVYFGIGRIHYEHIHGHVHHDHLYCLECGKIIEFRHGKMEQLQDQVAAEYNFKVVRHSMQMIGLCSECQDKEVVLKPEYKPSELERKAPSVPLTLIRNGEWVTLVEAKGGRRLRQRLADMGLAKGERFQVINNSFAGPVTIRVKGSSLALGQGVGHKLLVRLENKHENKAEDCN